MARSAANMQPNKIPMRVLDAIFKTCQRQSITI
jgi:hypothetical protein